MSPELDDLLCTKYSKIFARRHLSKTQSAMYWGFQCEDGWFQLLDDLCDKLQRRTDVDGDPQLEALQVKEKFGGLRFYVSSATDEQRALIQSAESLSNRTCEECGADGKLDRTGGWFSTRCREHARSGFD